MSHIEHLVEKDIVPTKWLCPFNGKLFGLPMKRLNLFQRGNSTCGKTITIVYEVVLSQFTRTTFDGIFLLV